MPTARFTVSGKVQGVFYRASTHMQAQDLGVAGYAKNLSDGRVEVLASGPADVLDVLEQWLHQGPPAAEVTAVSRENLPEQELHGFYTG